MSSQRYDGYRDSGVSWLGEIPEGWLIQRFDANTSTHRNTITPDRFEGQEVLHYSIPSVQETGDGAVEDGITIDSNKLVVSRAQLLVSKLNPHKQVVISATPHSKLLTIASTEFVPLIPTKSNGKYIQYVWQSTKCLHYLLARCDSATRSHQRVTPNDISKMSWAWPSHAEQIEIAAFLEFETRKIDSLIAKQQELIFLLNEKRQATVFHAVTCGLNPQATLKDSGVTWLGRVPAYWKVGKAGFYISVLPGYAFSSTEFSLDESHVKLLRGINVGVGALKWDEVVYWRRYEDDGLNAFELQAGDVVIGMDRPLISTGMRVAFVNHHDLPCLLLQRVAKVQPRTLIESRFLMRLLSSRAFEAHFSPETTGVSVPHISGEQITSFIIPIPPLEEQRRICDFVEMKIGKLGALDRAAAKAIELLKERRSALITAAVTGQIDVRGVMSKFAMPEELTA